MTDLKLFIQDLWALPSLWHDTRGQWACCGQFVLTVPLSATRMIKTIYSPRECELLDSYLSDEFGVG